MVSDLKIRLLLLREQIRASFDRLKPVSARHLSYRLPPSADSGARQQGIAIVAIVEDEAPYLAEWLEFHFMLGVQHAFLYDNGGTDETHDVLAPYFRAGLVTLIPWRNFSVGLNPQILAYAHVLSNFCMNFRWAACIDVDEFLFPVSGNSLDDTFAELSHLPVVSLPWINFGPSGHQTKPDGLVIANYTERAIFPPRADQYSLHRYKSIVNPREVDIAGSHYFWLRNRGATLINDRGVTFPNHQARDLRFATADKLRLHHYFTRSHEEIERKLAKGRVSKSGRVNPQALDRRLRAFKLATETDTTIMRFAPALEMRLAKRNTLNRKTAR